MQTEERGETLQDALIAEYWLLPQTPRGDHTYGTCPVHHVADWREVTDNNGTWGVCNRCWPPEPAREGASGSR